jgi:sec-independent protein translocase protein TatB
MFDFSFGEIALIGIVALVVIGPERLPRVARTAGVLFGRMQRYVTTVKADIAREIELDELKKLHTDVSDAARTVQQSITQHVSDAQHAVSNVASEVNSAMSSLNGGIFGQAAGGSTPATADAALPAAEEAPTIRMAPTEVDHAAAADALAAESAAPPPSPGDALPRPEAPAAASPSDAAASPEAPDGGLADADPGPQIELDLSAPKAASQKPV